MWFNSSGSSIAPFSIRPVFIVMEDKNKKHRQGRRVSEFSPVPALLFVKKPKKYNILIGEEPVQQRFAENLLGISCDYKVSVGDFDLQSDGQPKLVRTTSSSNVVLSPQVKDHTAFWSLDPIEKGSAGANAIVRYAASLLSLDKVDNRLIERLADILASSGTIDDLEVALWKAVWLLMGDVPPENKRWPQPWEDKYLWFNIPGVTPEFRLNSLYLDMTSYVFIHADEENNLSKALLRVSPSKIKVFKKIKLDLSKVYNTIKLLDLWRTYKTDPFVCAFQISNVWKPTQ